METINVLFCRSYKQEDLESLLLLFHDTVHAINIKDYSAEQVGVWASSIYDKAKWAKNLSERYAYVVESDNKIVGFGDMTKDGSLEHIYVDKDFQGIGIASLILKTCESKARAIGLTDIVTESSITAKPFFEKRGFSIVKQQEKVVGGLVFINYIMKKRIL